MLRDWEVQDYWRKGAACCFIESNLGPRRRGLITWRDNFVLSITHTVARPVVVSADPAFPVECLARGSFDNVD